MRKHCFIAALSSLCAVVCCSPEDIIGSEEFVSFRACPLCPTLTKDILSFLGPSLFSLSLSRALAPDEILGVLHDIGLDVLEATAESDEVHDVDIFLVQPRSGTANFDDEKLEEISHHLLAALGDKSGNALVVYEPAEVESDYKNDCMLEIELIGDHHPDTLHEILDWLALPVNNLEIMKAFTKTRTQHVNGHEVKIDIDKFYASPTNGVPIRSMQRRQVRQVLEHIVQAHGHGEVMVRLRHADEASILHPVPRFQHSQKIAVVVLNGPHHNDLLHEIADAFFELRLDVLQAEFDHEGNMDKHMFYLQHMNDDKTISRKLRHTIRARIATIYKTHFDQTNECLEMSVRPLEKSNAHKVTVATSNNSEEEEEEKEKTSDYSSNTSSDGSSDVSDVIRYSNDSFEHVSDNKNKRGIKRYRFSSKPGDLPTLAELSAEEQQMESETKQAAASSAGETKIDILVKQGEEEARLSTGSSDSPTSPRPQTGLGRDGLKQMIEQYNRSPRHDPSTSPMLAAGLWTRDVQRVHRMIRRIRAGSIWVNAYRVVNFDVPFGGMKQSGYGRENGLEGLRGYQVTKSVWIETTGESRDPFKLG